MKDDSQQKSTCTLETLECTPSWEWPVNAGKTLLKILRDDSAGESDRVRAADLAGDVVVMNDEIAGELLAILCNADEPDELRGRAAISFGPALESSDCEIEGIDDPEDALISEKTFRKIQKSLSRLYTDAGTPKLVRRRILEASVRAQEDWHPDAVRAAYASGDEEWMLTAVFGMVYVRGFNEQILESLENQNPDIHYHAVQAAGSCELRAAWPHVAALAMSNKTEKELRIAAIEAAGCIQPKKALEIFCDLDSDDEDIREAITEAQMMASLPMDDEDAGFLR